MTKQLNTDQSRPPSLRVKEEILVSAPARGSGKTASARHVQAPANLSLLL